MPRPSRQTLQPLHRSEIKMDAFTFQVPSDSPGPRRPALPPCLLPDLPLQGLGETSITRAQTPPTRLTNHRKGCA